MLRLVLLIALVWIGYMLVRKLLAAPKRPRPPAGQFEAMVSCSHCGLHLPKAEAITKAGRHYCCEAHALANDQP